MQMMRERLAASVSQELESLLWSRLGERFQPMVADVSQQLRQQLELSSPLRAWGGELFQTAPSKFLYYWISEDRKSLEAGTLFDEHLPDEAFESFRETISQTLGSQSWAKVSTLADRYRRICEETEPFPAFIGEIAAAQILSSPTHRKLLQTAARRAGVTLDSIIAGQTDENWDSCVEELEQQHLLQREFQVYCRDTGIQLCKFSNKDALDEAIHMGFRSFSTGRLISQERIVQLLTVTEKGKWLAKTNLWLALSLADALHQLDIEPKDVRWTFERDYRTISLFISYRDSLCMFEVHEEMVTPDQAFRFQTRASYFRPDAAVLVTPVPPKHDALLLLNKARRDLEPCRLIVLQDLPHLKQELEQVVQRIDDRLVRELLGRFEQLSFVDVGREVSEHLLGAAPPASVLEETSPEYAPPGLGSEARGNENAGAASTGSSTNDFDLDLELDLEGLDLGSPLPSTPSNSSMDDFDIDLDLDNLDLSPTRVRPAPISPSRAPEAAAPEPEAARPPATEPAHQAVSAPVAAPSPLPSLDDEFDLTEFDELLESPSATIVSPEPKAEAAPAAPATQPEPVAEVPAAIEPEPVAAEIPAAEPPAPVAAPEPAAQPAEAAVAEPERISDLPADMDLDFDIDLDLDSLMDLDLPPQAAPVEETRAPSQPEPQAQGGSGEDLPSEVLPEVASPLTEKSPEERFEIAARKLVEELQRKGIAAEVDDLLQEIREVPGCAAQVSTNEGLVFHGGLLNPEQSDLVAAFQSEVFGLFQQALVEAELGTLEGMVVEGGHGRLQVTPVKAEEVLWVSTFERVQRPDEPMASFPGEITLREAILKKVLEDLGQVEGIQGNLVTSRDGLPVEAQISPDLPAETIGVLLTQTLTDSESSLERLQLTPLRQILLRSSLMLFSLIPLDRETILITLLDPNANRDTWQARLQGAATMLASVFH